jgi:hypothetical protein
VLVSPAAPRGAVFVNVLFTAGSTPPSSNLKQKDKSRIEQCALDLCGIVTTGDTLSYRGGLCLNVSHFTTLTCPLFTFAATSL